MRLIPASCSLLPLLVACTHLAPVRHPGQYVTAKAPPRVWVVQAKSDTVREMTTPRVAGDTLSGIIAGVEQRIPLADVKEVQAVQGAPRRTAALILLPFASYGLYEIVNSALSTPYVNPHSNSGIGSCDCNLDNTCGC